ncbi:non-hydrolyzing UDP-N-acetylglucosamine 2-epimerase [Variovorax sp. HJSM1_2]|uniref:non-hydrolyzing UDP-N-acetylglucosamine 2-epimerase n=1 Tax=Variovorax sp. HJSM1_2 TaxID=3366263 RepID=UPI003BD6835E
MNNSDSYLNQEIKPIICVVGARPNFMKMAPILRAFSNIATEWPVLLVHTGQHYDSAMSDQLFEDLHLPVPDINLEVGSASHAVQTAEVMKRFEPVLDQHHPSCVVVVGDVNSTLACALVANKKGIPVAHVEAGLRSNDRAMPEEINRILTDQLSMRLYTTERSAAANLNREGVSDQNIKFVGNVMIDSLRENIKYAKPYLSTVQAHEPAAVKIFREGKEYGLVTLHRPSNVDDPEILKTLLTTLGKVASQIPLIFALHPRTKNNIEKFKLLSLIDPGNTVLLPPQGYVEMLGLMKDAAVVLTDSGGIQEETTALGVPCLTLRENTERPITIDEGTNILVGSDSDLLLYEINNILNGSGKKGRVPELWDGNAAIRIVEDLRSHFFNKSATF